MSNFADRVSQYPMVSDSIKASSNAYNWVSSGERFKSIFQLSEHAVGLLKEKAKTMVNQDMISQMDDLACRQILDRIESLFPTINRPTEELLGPISDRALTAAESYMEYFLPNSRSTSTQQQDVPLSRYDRLIRLQSVLLNSDTIQSAQSTISSAYQKMQTTFNSLASAAKSTMGSSTLTDSEKQEQGCRIATLASLVSQYQAAAMIAFPKFKNFIDGAVGQSQILITELRQSDHPSQFALDQLRTIVHGLHATLTGINERRESWMQGIVPGFPKSSPENIELQVLSSPLSEDAEVDSTKNGL